MKSALLPRLFAFAAPLVICLTGCISLDKLPKVSLPKIDVPFIGGNEAAPANDPVIPYTLAQTLGYGHTLEFSAFAGSLSPQKLFMGKAMVDEAGDLNLGAYGKVRVGGTKADQALKLIQTAFLKKRGEAIINVHLARIEGVALVTINGAVKDAGVVQWFDGANVATLIPYAGGRSASAKGEAVYVFHNGTRRFFGTLAAASIATIEPGDIITLSEDL